MKKVEYTHYLNRISELIRDISLNMENISEDQFRKNTELKERIYFMLQEIGQQADEILRYYNENEYEQNTLALLKSLKTARLNLLQELNDQMIFSIIKNDFPDIQQKITQTINEAEKTF